jgi:hypothetical protein
MTKNLKNHERVVGAFTLKAPAKKGVVLEEIEEEEETTETTEPAAAAADAAETET